MTTPDSASSKKRPTHYRYMILLMVFLSIALNHGDRATFSIAGPDMVKAAGLDIVALGYLISTFTWAYVLGQYPGGWLLDRFGSKRVLVTGVFTWSLFVFLVGFSTSFDNVWVTRIMIFGFIFMMGLIEAPTLPANSRFLAAWFPARERGKASGFTTAAQYFALVVFLPLMGWFSYRFGWESVFWFMGGLGILVALVMHRVLADTPKVHPLVNSEELDYIQSGGGLTNLKATKKGDTAGKGYTRKLLTNRLALGVYMGQFFFTVLSYFFLTWFPVYLVHDRGMTILKAGFVASLPALCGCAGALLGGVLSDYMLSRGFSLSAARKTPIVIGMLLAVSMVICNYVDSAWIVVAIMSLAFFGKGFGAMGWCVVSDFSPKEAVGLSGGLFNMIGNISGIFTPIIIAYIIKDTGSFNGALVFVGVCAFLNLCCYLFVAGKIQRLSFDTEHNDRNRLSEEPDVSH
ncbi:TPA: MFS transporter [Klebsiella quasipneumoniae subsp. quasipneumoniae]|uniref:MFS transporter n=1 Tax=Klebsiella quasipneumoniae TaxID=1463165 RepID=UPI001CF6BAAA|nr:MFS transporter [Klebsiella quasipneumoniae]MCB3857120.1 MFS transporter [Klebsiella quasipneumoniae]HDH1548778.1 MFS transporter [Klebsiella quasipneumoniae subsp. quasipneumoniae]